MKRRSCSSFSMRKMSWGPLGVTRAPQVYRQLRIVKEGGLPGTLWLWAGDVGGPTGAPDATEGSVAVSCSSHRDDDSGNSNEVYIHLKLPLGAESSYKERNSSALRLGVPGGPLNES